MSTSALIVLLLILYPIVSYMERHDRSLQAKWDEDDIEEDW